MKYQINTQIEINATPEKIWAVLMDFENYPHWNPFIKSIKGEALAGSQLSAQIDQMRFKPFVTKVVVNQHFSWMGSLWITGLFDGHHQFDLIPQANGSTLLIHSESFSGLLVRLFKKMLDTQTLAGFHAMNSSLKDLIEQN